MNPPQRRWLSGGLAAALTLVSLGVRLPAGQAAHFTLQRHAPAAAIHCPALPAPTGPVVNVDSVAELQDAVDTLSSGTTILIADGVYTLTNTLNIRAVNDVALRSLSGNREAVVLRGQGMSNGSYGNVPHVIAIYDADDRLIADVTLRDAYFHLVQVHGEDAPQRPRFYNLRLIDSGEQFIKGSTDGQAYADGGEVACSTIAYTDEARSDYTNGVDVLGGADWVIRDNVFRNIRAPAGLAGPAVLMWRNSLDTVVERNLFIECDRAIALGLAAPDANSRGDEDTYDHQGGIVRNNFIYRAGAGDVGITVNYARDVRVYHNTVLLNGTFPWGAIEYRFSATSADIRYNLTDAPIWQRDGAAGTVLGNVTNAQPGWFVNAALGDLHLNAGVTAAIDQALPLGGVSDDFDGALRPGGDAPDIGADEYGELVLPGPYRLYVPTIRKP